MPLADTHTFLALGRVLQLPSRRGGFKCQRWLRLWEEGVHQSSVIDQADRDLFAGY